MLTNKRVMYLEKGDVIHDWNVEFSFPIDQMPEPPNMDDKGCLFLLIFYGYMSVYLCFIMF